jgi:ribosome biogenesis GTPase / thiamine phosphate phosphatase
MPEPTLPGLIVRAQSGFFTVETPAGVVVCQLRGKLKRGPRKGDLAAIGDQVQISLQPDGTGMIETVLPRSRAIVRLDPRPQGVYQQVILANPDQAIFVFACAHPAPRLRMLDRFLVIAEREHIPAVIVANKVDLVGMQAARETFGHYATLGYSLIYTSVKQQLGLDQLRETLTGKLSGLAGPSGVGKSSLLNAIQPGLGQAVREVSEAAHKGRHTTVVRQLFPLDAGGYPQSTGDYPQGGGYVADTPGLRSVALWDTRPEELDAYFPELAPLVAKCQFSDCTHVSEPGCAVRAAVEAGRVHPARYESYLRLRASEA